MYYGSQRGYSDLHASLPNSCLVPFAEAHDVVVNSGRFASLVDLLIRSRLPRISDIADDGIIKEDGGLRHNANLLAKTKQQERQHVQ